MGSKNTIFNSSDSYQVQSKIDSFKCQIDIHLQLACNRSCKSCMRQSHCWIKCTLNPAKCKCCLSEHKHFGKIDKKCRYLECSFW
jgi:hypothetical protein